MEPFDDSKLLLRVYKQEKQLAYAIIPAEMWEREEELKIVISGMEHMRKKRIGAAFFHGKGGV